MNIFDSFVTWLEGLAEPLIKLYHEDSTTFFVGAIMVVLILLIIVIVIARRAENDDKPSKKIKYDDIDWSVEGDSAKAESSAVAELPERSGAAVKAEAAAAKEDAKKSYGIGEVDVDKNTFGHEGLPQEVADALMRTVRTNDDFAVPMWMTKQTLSLDDMDMVDAQEWVEEQLQAEEARAHDRQVERATVERIAEILEKIDLCDKAKEDYKKRHAENAPAETPAVSEKIDLDEIAPLEPEAVEEKAAAPLEPETVEESKGLETGTLAKILREAEEIKAESKDQTHEEDNGGSEPDWGIAATLARLEAMQAENDSLLREVEKDGEYYEDKAKASDIESLMTDDLPDKPIITSLEEELMDSGSYYEVPEEPETILPQKRRVRRFGLDNRDTNRSGRKFTEEELMKQIRD